MQCYLSRAVRLSMGTGDDPRHQPKLTRGEKGSYTSIAFSSSRSPYHYSLITLTRSPVRTWRCPPGRGKAISFHSTRAFRILVAISIFIPKFPWELGSPFGRFFLMVLLPEAESRGGGTERAAPCTSVLPIDPRLQPEGERKGCRREGQMR